MIRWGTLLETVRQFARDRLREAGEIEAARRARRPERSGSGATPRNGGRARLVLAVAGPNLADCALIERTFAESLKLYRESLRLALILGDHVEIGFEVQGTAMSLAGLGEADAALRLAAGVEADWARIGAGIRVRFWSALIDRHIGAAREQLGARAEGIWTAGLQQSFEETIRLATSRAPAAR